MRLTKQQQRQLKSIYTDFESQVEFGRILFDVKAELQSFIETEMMVAAFNGFKLGYKYGSISIGGAEQYDIEQDEIESIT